jgi:hypothetical protein
LKIAAGKDLTEFILSIAEGFEMTGIVIPSADARNLSRAFFHCMGDDRKLMLRFVVNRKTFFITARQQVDDRLY